MKISYGVTVCDEAEELNSLLNFLLLHIDNNDEVVVLKDTSKTNYDVHQVVFKYIRAFKEKGISFGVLDSELNGDFATFKNQLIELASGDYLFQIDADEIPNQFLIENIKPVLKINSTIDCFYIPRVNKVNGLTQEHIQRWGWRVDDQDRVNFPDFQMRLFKLNTGIKWRNKVHEVLEGQSQFSILPHNTEDFCLYHIKSIEKQEKQNNFYNTL
jgi:glycosyltransferase involved in cell wall biosynthesis